MNKLLILYSKYLSFRELLLQGWMKPGRDDLAPNVALVSRRFNEVKIFFCTLRILLRDHHKRMEISFFILDYVNVSYTFS